MKIEYHPAIETELVEIRDYYEQRSPHLGTDFINEFERRILHIAAAPKRWMCIRGDIRSALMKRFPYVILFRVVDDERIRVTVIKHERWHPSYGIQRR